jgi:hypothetical protein
MTLPLNSREEQRNLGRIKVRQRKGDKKLGNEYKKLIGY